MNIILANLKFYLRYADDVLAAFDYEQDSLNFLSFLNNRHPIIKFAIQKQTNRSMLFKISHFKHITNRPIYDFS